MMRRFSKKQVLIGLAILVVVVAGGVFGVSSMQGEKGTITSLSMAYPSGWQPSGVSQAEREAGVLSKVHKAAPKANAVIRGVVVDLATDFTINELPDKLVGTLGANIKNFEVVNKGVAQIGSYEAAQVRYTEQDQTTDKKYEILMLVIPTKNQSFYLVFRAPSGEYAKNEADFTKIIDNFSDHLEKNL